MVNACGVARFNCMHLHRIACTISGACILGDPTLHAKSQECLTSVPKCGFCGVKNGPISQAIVIEFTCEALFCQFLDLLVLSQAINSP